MAGIVLVRDIMSKDVRVVRLDSSVKEVVAILTGLASLALPWWTFIFLVDGKFASTFYLFLWGVVKAGFLRAHIPFEWWSYTTFALVAIGALFGLVGYRLLRGNTGSARKLVALEMAFTIGGCILYLSSLLFTFATFFKSYQDLWMIAPLENHGPFAIGVYSAFHFSFYHMYGAAMFESLSLGFFLAVVASVLSSIALYKLRKHINNQYTLQEGHLK